MGFSGDNRLSDLLFQAGLESVTPVRSLSFSRCRSTWLVGDPKVRLSPGAIQKTNHRTN